jgi:hypothetical protein
MTEDHTPATDGLSTFKVGDRVRVLPDDDLPDDGVGRPGAVLAVDAPDDITVHLERTPAHPLPNIKHFRRDQLTHDQEDR